MLSELDEIAVGFFFKTIFVVCVTGLELRLNEGTDLCQVNTHMHAQPLVCFSPVKTSHLGLNSYENVSLVLYFQDVSAVTGTTCMHVQVLNVILSAS